MKRVTLLSLAALILLFACSEHKNQWLGGLEKLKWHSDVTEMKNYMENDVKADYKKYKINRTEKTLSMFFEKGEFAGEKAEKWELKSKDGKFYSYSVFFPFNENTFEKIAKTLSAKLGEPDFADTHKKTWKRQTSEGLKEKITLRKFEDAIVLTAETEVK